MVVAAERFVKIQKAFVNQEEYIVMEWENLGSQYLVDNEFLKVRQDKVAAILKTARIYGV